MKEEADAQRQLQEQEAEKLRNQVAALTNEVISLRASKASSKRSSKL